MSKPYAGVGARKTPKEILKAMTSLGKFLAKKEFLLRSGAAPGADEAFEKGCVEADGMSEIYLPWEGFQDHDSQRFTISTRAYEIAQEFHPAWKKLSDGQKKLIARNTYQLFGDTGLGPRSKFLICWTPGGKTVGGTGQAIRIAQSYRIPVLNMGSMSLEELESELMKLISEGS